MALTSTIATNELARLGLLAYEGRPVYVGLADDSGNTLTAESTLTAWQGLELASGVNGYSTYQTIVGTGTSDTVAVEYTFPYFDAVFTASGGSLLYDNVFISVGDLGAAYTITTSERAVNTVTITTSAPHGLIATDVVYISGTTNNTFDGFHTLLSAPTSTTFTFVLIGADQASGADTGNVEQVTYPDHLYGLLTESPAITLLNAQTQTYRLYLSTDN